MKLLRNLFQKPAHGEREALIARYVELTGIPTDQPSHGLAMRAHLRAINSERADEADVVGLVWQAGIDAAEAEYARRGAEYTARHCLTTEELEAAVATYSRMGYREFIAIAQAVESGRPVGPEAETLYHEVRHSSWMAKIGTAFQVFNSDPENARFLDEAVEACSIVMERSLASKGLNGPSAHGTVQ